MQLTLLYLHTLCEMPCALLRVPFFLVPHTNPPRRIGVGNKVWGVYWKNTLRSAQGGAGDTDEGENCPQG